MDDGGCTLPIYEIGELWVKGYNVMKGYWGNEKATQESTQDGFMKTGDLAVMVRNVLNRFTIKDAEGYVSIVGRKKDMIIRAGENIYPR